MNLIQYVRLGYDFNYRLTLGIQNPFRWPFYIRAVPKKLEEQKHPDGRWYVKFFPRYF